MTFRLLFFSLLATAMGQSVVMTTLPPLGREVGLSEFNVAFLMSSSAIMYALGNAFWSRIGKKRGYRRILIIGLSGYTMGTLIFASVWFVGLQGWLAGSALFAALLLSRTGQATIMSATPPSVVGMAIAISNDNERVKAISKVSSAHSLGQILGPTFAGLMVSIHLLAPLYGITLMTLIAVVLVWRFLPQVHAASANAPAGSKASQPARTIQPFVPVLIAMNVSVFLAIAMMQQSLAFFLIDHHGLTTTEAAQAVGLAMMISAVCALTIQVTLVQRTSMHPGNLLKIAFPLLSIGYLIIYLHQQPMHLYIAMLFLGSGLGISYPAIAALASSSCKPENQATVTGFITASPAMGYIIGPPIAATLYSMGNRMPFIAASVLLALVTVIAITHLRARPTKVNP
ncbi:MFS transporter [Alteromonas lipolytica]|uniref:MFS transporter n=1 Tax=Alteromonas lipolytica TaxID=1856405 RepID=UPI0009F1B538|nr:MFS transporter [Alteromonas lipolytica]GGF62264.1 tetracycline resistance MFS efflux pump [Alteromonas lipolytica]